MVVMVEGSQETSKLSDNLRLSQATHARSFSLHLEYSNAHKVEAAGNSAKGKVSHLTCRLSRYQ